MEAGVVCEEHYTLWLSAVFDEPLLRGKLVVVYLTSIVLLPSQRRTAADGTGSSHDARPTRLGGGGGGALQLVSLLSNDKRWWKVGRRHHLLVDLRSAVLSGVVLAGVVLVVLRSVVLAGVVVFVASWPSAR